MILLDCLPVQTPQSISLDEFWQIPPLTDKDNIAHLALEKRNIVQDKLKKTAAVYPTSALLICNLDVVANQFCVPETNNDIGSWHCSFIESSDSYQLPDTIFTVGKSRNSAHVKSVSDLSMVGVYRIEGQFQL